jgi:hypothetical protein
MASPTQIKQERIDTMYEHLLEAKEIPISKLHEFMRKKYTLGERVRKDYIGILASKPKVKVDSGNLKIQ